MRRERRSYGGRPSGYLAGVPLQSSGRVRRRGRLATSGALLAAAVVLSWALPASDLASSTERAGAAPLAPSASPVPDRYERLRERGDVVAVVRRPVALREAPSLEADALALVGERTEFDSPRVFAVSGR